MRLYFCSDIHGSEICWRKFLAAPSFYGADVIVVGGDITGKFIVPIIRQPNGHAEAEFLGVARRTTTATDLLTLKRRIADAGQYAFEASREEYDATAADPVAVDRLFHRLVSERVGTWLELAAERLANSGVRCLVSGGNDDFFEIDEVLAGSSVIEDPNGRRLELADGFEVIGMGYGNPTPWACPRDISEAELAQRITALADEVRDPSRAIFNFHVPPHASGLDMAPRLDADLRMTLTSGGPELVPVGSTAVRDAIERYRPMLALHGHIHESKGVGRIGPTTIVNPGSEYAEGVLNGALIELDRGIGVRDVQLVSG
ncbi:MAG: metallophosphoesterase family protein [Candidatus Limnocylindrales bacterium]